ncbi:2154_t:CDS:2 [Dentiscutata heterogama]|uniref:2154_t:CDS:1 n=1 Tax=Dentiscutata heterogama TaxID=1316150 RepID=A0ACA9KK63_9GLOM|nr:2154_t:CDS:2 [Dentiscutata heterogama]
MHDNKGENATTNRVVEDQKKISNKINQTSQEISNANPSELKKTKSSNRSSVIDYSTIVISVSSGTENDKVLDNLESNNAGSNVSSANARSNVSSTNANSNPPSTGLLNPKTEMMNIEQSQKNQQSIFVPRPPPYQQPPHQQPPSHQQSPHQQPPPPHQQPPHQQPPQPPLQMRPRNDTNPMQQQLLRPLQPQQRSQTNSNIYNTNEHGQLIFQNKSNLLQENKSEMKFSTVPLDGLKSVENSDIKFESNNKNFLPNQGWTSSKENPNIRQRASQPPTDTKNSKNPGVEKEQSSEGQTKTNNKQVQSQNPFSTSLHWTWILLIFLALAALAFTVYRLDSIYVEDKKVHITMQRPFLEVFTNSTVTLMQDLNMISDLPASDTIMKGTVLYKRLANILETSPGFKNNGAAIASYLRHYSTQIMEAGEAFEDMYRQGDLVFWILDREITQILEKLKPNIFGQIFFKDDDPAFFKERIKDMMQVVDAFKSKVTAAIRAVRVADSIRDQTEKGLFRGIKIEAEKFVKLGTRQNEYRSPSSYINDELIIDIENAKKHLEQAQEILDLLYRSGYGLNRLIIILNNYRNRLHDIEAELDDKISITKNQIDKLKKLLDNLKECHEKFSKRDYIDNGFDDVTFDSKNEVDGFVKIDDDN